MNFGIINVATIRRRSWFVMSVVFSIVLTAISFSGQSAHAENLVKLDNGEPQSSVLTSWTEKGSKSIFTVRDGEIRRHRVMTDVTRVGISVKVHGPFVARGGGVSGTDVSRL